MAVLVHDPVGLGALGRAPLVEHEHLLDADHLGAGGGEGDGLVGASGLPVAGAGGAVGADAVGILTVPRLKKYPSPSPWKIRLGWPPAVGIFKDNAKIFCLLCTCSKFSNSRAANHRRFHTKTVCDDISQTVRITNRL